jgi:hypothetical protein
VRGSGVIAGEVNLSAPRKRRWPILVVAFVVVLVVLLAVALGAARATGDAASAAAQLVSEQRYGTAVALYRAIARRTGPVYLFDRGDVADAPLNAQRTMLAWAASLAQAGNADQAVALTRAVTDPRLLTAARQEESNLLLAAAKAEAARGSYAAALQRLQQLTAPGLAGNGPAGQVTQLRIQYLVAEAQALLGAGDGIHAVAALDEAAQLGQGGAAAAAPLLPAALLAAANQEIEAASYTEAATMLQRLTSEYGGASQARQARSLLDSGQPVTGTLVDRSGRPISATVRLSSHFFSEPGGYRTSGPFFYTDADSDGNFRFDSIPPGGPYVFEIFHGGNWVTFVDPNTGQPANPVTVAPLAPADLAFITLS